MNAVVIPSPKDLPAVDCSFDGLVRQAVTALQENPFRCCFLLLSDQEVISRLEGVFRSQGWHTAAVKTFCLYERAVVIGAPCQYCQGNECHECRMTGFAPNVTAFNAVHPRVDRYIVDQGEHDALKEMMAAAERMTRNSWSFKRGGEGASFDPRRVDRNGLNVYQKSVLDRPPQGVPSYHSRSIEYRSLIDYLTRLQVADDITQDKSWLETALRERADLLVRQANGSTLVANENGLLWGSTPDHRSGSVRHMVQAALGTCDGTSYNTEHEDRVIDALREGFVALVGVEGVVQMSRSMRPARAPRAASPIDIPPPSLT